MLQKLDEIKKDYLRILESFLYYAKRIDEQHQEIHFNKSESKNLQGNSQKGLFRNYKKLPKAPEQYHLRLCGGNRV